MFNIPLLVLSGYFSPQDNFVPYLFPIKYISPFKWIFQLLVTNEFTTANISCMNPPENCNPLLFYNFNESIAVDFGVLTSVAIFFGILGYLMVYFCIKIKV